MDERTPSEECLVNEHEKHRCDARTWGVDCDTNGFQDEHDRLTYGEGEPQLAASDAVDRVPLLPRARMRQMAGQMRRQDPP